MDCQSFHGILLLPGSARLFKAYLERNHSRDQIFVRGVAQMPISRTKSGSTIMPLSAVGLSVEFGAAFVPRGVDSVEVSMWHHRRICLLHIGRVQLVQLLCPTNSVILGITTILTTIAKMSIVSIGTRPTRGINHRHSPGNWCVSSSSTRQLC
jgi:hypothetical protein